MSEKAKMFNRAIVFGSVLKKPVRKKTNGGSQYASLQLQCPNDVHGDVRVWGKVWGAAGQDALEDLKTGDVIRLEGVFQQYESEHAGLVTNFNFFNYQPCTKTQKNDLRAVFILVGDVEGFEPGSEFLEITLCYVQKEGEDGERAPEFYRLSVPVSDELAKKIDSGIIGARVKLKGFLENEEDEFCETTLTRPFIKELDVLLAAPASASDTKESVPF